MRLHSVYFGRMADRQRVPFRIHHKVALAALHLLAGVVSARSSALGGLGALAINRTRRRLFRASRIEARRPPKRRQNDLHPSPSRPAVEIVLNRRKRWKILG